MAGVLEALITASERAACIARSCCTSTPNTSLLVAEKCEGEANARFERDFKTVADVLAQESARYEIAHLCPELASGVRGEECSDINGINIAVQDSLEKTAELLSALVPSEAARQMAEATHKELSISDKVTLPQNLPVLNAAELEVWIDPIDATAEFIAGVRGEANAGGGLSCVTVLIGAYMKSTGDPVIGVINQPFADNGDGRIFWGVNYGETQKWSGANPPEVTNSNIVLMSGAEKSEIVDKIKAAGWEMKSIPGAGHKLLKVALDEAAAYIVSQATTFRWDTCAPHAILRAKGGNLLSYKTLLPITYNDAKDADTKQYCNSEGIIAFSHSSVFEELKNILIN